MGRRALHRATAQALKFRPDVDPGKVKERPTKQRGLWLRLVDRRPSRTPRSWPHRRLAGIQNRNRTLCERSNDGSSPGKSSRSQAWRHRRTRSRPVLGGWESLNGFLLHIVILRPAFSAGRRTSVLAGSATHARKFASRAETPAHRGSPQLNAPPKTAILDHKK